MAKKKQGLDFGQFFAPQEPSADLDFLLGAPPEETVARAQARGLPLLDLPVRSVAPDPQQVRRLPPPDELLSLEANGDAAAAALLSNLRELGQSMREHGQLQPAIVYPYQDPANAAVTHRLLHGQRRWSAALLAEVPSLWVVEVSPPSEVSRLVRQYEENERRADLTDVERAWYMIALKEALQQEARGEVPWSVVEDQVQISTQRRQDLLRLLRFSPDGQALILRHGWSEWTLRPLHMAINNGTIAADAATALLRSLADAGEVTAPLVSNAVDLYVDAPEHEESPNANRSTSSATSSRLPSRGSDLAADIARRVSRARRSMTLVQNQLPSVTDANARQAVRQELDALRLTLQQMVDMFDP